MFITYISLLPLFCFTPASASHPVERSGRYAFGGGWLLYSMTNHLGARLPFDSAIRTGRIPPLASFVGRIRPDLPGYAYVGFVCGASLR